MSHALQPTPSVEDSREKYGLLFGDELDGLRLAAHVIESELHTDPHRVLHVTLHVADVADWDLRRTVQNAAREFERQYRIGVVCMYRDDDPAATVRPPLF